MSKEAILLISFLLGAFVFTCIGCAGHKSQVEQTKTWTPPKKEMARVSFPEQIRIVTPESEPETPKDHVQAGLFFFDRGAFSRAAGEFATAGEMVAEQENAFYRACKKAEAVSWLVADNMGRFRGAVSELEGAYSDYERLDLKSTDRQAWKLIQTAQALKR